MSFVRRIDLFSNLAFRVISGSLIGFLLSALLAFFFLSERLEQYLMERQDGVLKTAVLDLTALIENVEEDPERLAEELERYGHTHGIQDSFFRIYHQEGQLQASSIPDYWPDLNNLSIPWQDIRANLFTWRTTTSRDRPAGIRQVFFNLPDGRILHIGFDLRETRSVIRQGRWLYGGTMIFVVLFGSLVGWLVTRQPLAGIRSVDQAAGRITHDMDFGHRVQTPTGSQETDQLATAFNTMLTKIQDLIRNQKETMDNIAHDIRSPVARMRSGAESALHDGKNPELSGQVIEDCDHILSLINTLLEISATEAGTMQWHLERVQPADVLRELAELFAPVFEIEEKELVLQLEDNATIETDPRVFQRVLANLVDNAIKYGGDGGKVLIELKQEGTHVIIVVEDDGIGIAAKDRDKIFRRFYRCDASRNAPGTGLGLSFCRSAIEAMGGQINCESEQGRGTRMIITLPTV